MLKLEPQYLGPIYGTIGYYILAPLTSNTFKFHLLVVENTLLLSFTYANIFTPKTWIPKIASFEIACTCVCLSK
jgi:hypothetical protein